MHEEHIFIHESDDSLSLSRSSSPLFYFFEYICLASRCWLPLDKETRISCRERKASEQKILKQIEFFEVCYKHLQNEEIETARVKRESRARESYKIPPKAGPYHNAQQEDEFNMMEIQ